MANEIGITWTSDQKQLIADMQKRQLLMDQEIARLQKLAGVGKQAGAALAGGYKDVNAQLDRLGRLADSAFKKPISAMDAHLARLKELRVLYRMGKIDVEQFNAASAGSKKQFYNDTGMTARLRDQKRLAAEAKALAEKQLAVDRAASAKSLAEQKNAALALDLQRKTAQAEQLADAKSAAAKLLAEQKAAAQALRLQQLTELHKQAQDAKAAADKAAADAQAAADTALAADKANAAKMLAEQKASALALDMQKREAIQAANDKARQDAASQLAEQRAAAKSLHLQRLTAIDDLRKRNKAAADDVRRSLLSERDLARQNFRERMRQLWDLRSAGALSSSEYQAAAQKALETWKQASKIDMSKVWGMVPSQLTSVLSLTAAVAAGIKVVRAEFENLKKMQDEAKGATLTYAEAVAPAKQNLGLDMTGDDLDKWTLETSQKTGQSRTFLARAASGALSAKGARTSRQALEDLTEMIPLERYSPEELKEASAGVMQQLNVEAVGTTRKSVIGQQMAAKIASRVESSADFAGHVSKTAVGASAFGDNSRDVYSIAAYLANASGDRTGQTSSSGTIDLEADLQILSSGVESGSLGMGPIKGGLGKDTRSRLKAISQDPRFAGLRDRLLGENEDPEITELFKMAGRMTARAQNFGAIRQLYKNDPTAWKNFDAARDQIPELGPDSEKFVDKQLKDLDSPEHQVAIQNQNNAAAAERMQIANNRGARISAAREGLQKNLHSAGVGWAGQTDASWNFGWNTWGGTQDPERVQAKLQRGAASALRRNEANASSDAERESMERSAKALEENAAVLERLADSMNALIQQQQGVQVNVFPPGGAGDKPGQPAGAGLAGGKL